jgi:AhpD family alkylhydroperoxidase
MHTVTGRQRFLVQTSSANDARQPPDRSGEYHDVAAEPLHVAHPAPRIKPGRLRELGLTNWVLCRLLSRGARVPDAHFFSTLGRQRALFRGWLLFAARLMPGGSLSRRETELAILRVAHLRRCRYELQHHTRLARRVGLDAVAVERVGVGPTADGWSRRERALLRAVDALLTKRDIDDDSWQAISTHLSEPQLVELCVLVGHYDMLAMTVAALRIAPDFDGSANEEVLFEAR